MPAFSRDKNESHLIFFCPLYLSGIKQIVLTFKKVNYEREKKSRERHSENG
jgi:hypothetical protein